jgi:hypothetical protein
LQQLRRDAGQGNLEDGMCSDCRNDCEGCEAAPSVSEGYCQSCWEERNCTECSSLYSPDEIVMGVCESCRALNESEEGK